MRRHIHGFGSLTKSLLDVATPTLLRESSTQALTPTRTSWMNGLRGICAVIVVNYHYLAAYTKVAKLGYNAHGVAWASNNLAILPPFCLLWDGASSVNIFFTISGFVCSYKALELMTLRSEASSLGPVMESLSSSAFRRTFRLLLPVLAITLLTTLWAYGGGFGLTDYIFAKHAKRGFQWVSGEVNPPRFKSIFAQLGFWAREVLKLVNLFEPKAIYPKHDSHLWTIGYEYRLSLHIYLVLMILARCQPQARLAAFGLLGLVYGYWHHWEGPLFFLGAAGAQWDILRQMNLRQDRHVPQSTRDEMSSKEGADAGDSGSSSHELQLRDSTRKPLFRYLGYVVAVYFIAFPVHNTERAAPAWSWVNAWIPSWYNHREGKFPKSIGTSILLFLLLTSPQSSPRNYLLKVLESRTAAYLGKIMFALYLVHGPVLHAIGYAVAPWIWRWMGGSKTAWQWSAGMFGGWVVSMALCLWAADVFNRQVESRCIQLQGYIEKWCTKEKESRIGLPLAQTYSQRVEA